MKAMQCELCGSTDIVKDGDFFVCQACGMKYTLESARKLLVEGTVKVDRTDDVSKILVIANEAVTSSNWAKAEEYADKALEIDPNCMDAWHIRGKAIDWQSTIKNDRTVEACKSYEHYIDLICKMSEKSRERAESLAISLINEIAKSTDSQVRLFVGPFEKAFAQPELITEHIPAHIKARTKLIRRLQDGMGSSTRVVRFANESLPNVYKAAAYNCVAAALNGVTELDKAWKKINPFEYWITDADLRRERLYGKDAIDDTNERKQFNIMLDKYDEAIAILNTTYDLAMLSGHGLYGKDAVRKVLEALINIENEAINLTSRRVTHFRTSYKPGDIGPGTSFTLKDSFQAERQKNVDKWRKKLEALDPERLKEYATSLNEKAQKRIQTSAQSKAVEQFESANPDYDTQHGIPELQEELSSIPGIIKTSSDELELLKTQLSNTRFGRRKREALQTQIDQKTQQLVTLKKRQKEVASNLQSLYDRKSFGWQRYLNEATCDVVLLAAAPDWAKSGVSSTVQLVKSAVGDGKVADGTTFLNAYPDKQTVVSGAPYPKAKNIVEKLNAQGAIAYVQYPARGGILKQTPQ